MGVKVKWIVIVCTVLLVGLSFGFFVSFSPADAKSTQKITTTVTYDYHVVAGHEMVPTPPDPEPSWVEIGPGSGINFTVDPPVYNFGNITMRGTGRLYLLHGGEYTPTGSAYATVNITNLLGYDINITSLTAEVTAGTETLKFYGPGGMGWGENFTLVFIDILDPWSPTTRDDEVNYYTGEVKVGLGPGGGLMEGDTYSMAVREPCPVPVGPASLLKPDLKGDANETGHVAPPPIPLANGSTFTEYFGIIIFGVAKEGTQIDGTITLSLTYEYEVQPGYPVPSFTYTPDVPIINETGWIVLTFDASNSTANGGNLTDPDSYAWDFGDGTNGTGMIVAHNYTTPRNYTVVLKVTDSEGLWSAASKSIIVRGLPVPSFTYTPTTPAINETVTFNASASTAEGYNDRILSYEWNFDDGDIAKVIGFREGVEKYVDSNHDTFYNASEPIYEDINQTEPNRVDPGDIRLLPPPGYLPNSTVALGDTDVGDALREFNEEGHREDVQENGKYDNGETIYPDRQIITHTYTDAGTFTVTLNITDTEGLWNTKSESIKVGGPAAEFPWLWVGVGAVVVVVVVAAVAIIVRRRK